MIEVHKLSSLGAADHGWLDARHHFSFAGYHDPARMGWGRIRVWNDDRIAAGSGFPPHSHRDMEIITYVRSGAITHQDSLGNTGRTVAGDVQVMSAGTGVTHSEYNKGDGETTLFQIWILPDQPGGEPHWGMRPFPKADRAGRWTVLASGDAEDKDALPIRADARVLGATLAAGEVLDFATSPGCVAYLVLAVGAVTVNGDTAEARDGVAIGADTKAHIIAVEYSELVLVVAPV